MLRMSFRADSTGGAFSEPGEGSEAELTEPLRFGIELERKPDVDVFEREGEASREDAHHLPAGPVDLDRPLEDTRVGAEAPAPEPLAYEHYLGRSLLLVLFGERAAEEGIHAREAKERRRDRAVADAVRRFEAGQAHSPVAHERALFERRHAVPIPQVERHRRVHVVEVEAGSRMAHVHESLGVGIGKRRQENSVHQSEDRDGEADPAREGQNRESGETLVDRESLEDGAEGDHDGV